ncbi:hypothetical protein ACFVZH_38645 [Streptomyces sp. NPDC059534]|uniref:hypothetical protein n=1 Tax=Streptomyces sp. NPDC059534 TaxID=3346859 RepID=UPI0036A13134
MNGNDQAQHVQSAAPVIVMPGSWPVEFDSNWDRWQIGIPEATLRKRQAQDYKDTTGEYPPVGWDGEKPHTYAKVGFKSRRRVKRVVLQVKIVKGGEFDGVRISPIITNGRVLSSVELEHGTRRGFQFSRFRARSTMIRLVAVAMTVMAAFIAAAFDAGKFFVLYHVSGVEAAVWLLVAFALGAVGSILNLIAGDFFKDDPP